MNDIFAIQKSNQWETNWWFAFILILCCLYILATDAYKKIRYGYHFLPRIITIFLLIPLLLLKVSIGEFTNETVVSCQTYFLLSTMLMAGSVYIYVLWMAYRIRSVEEKYLKIKEDELVCDLGMLNMVYSLVTSPYIVYCMYCAFLMTSISEFKDDREESCFEMQFRIMKENLVGVSHNLIDLSGSGSVVLLLGHHCYFLYRIHAAIVDSNRLYLLPDYYALQHYFVEHTVILVGFCAVPSGIRAIGEIFYGYSYISNEFIMLLMMSGIILLLARVHTWSTFSLTNKHLTDAELTDRIEVHVQKIQQQLTISLLEARESSDVGDREFLLELISEVRQREGEEYWKNSFARELQEVDDKQVAVCDQNYGPHYNPPLLPPQQATSRTIKIFQQVFISVTVPEHDIFPPPGPPQGMCEYTKIEMAPPSDYLLITN